jgi:hypothetical protein
MRSGFFFLLLIGMFTGSGSSQTQRSNGLGTVRVSVPSVRYDYAVQEKEEVALKIHIKGAKTTRRVTFVGRNVVRNAQGEDEYHIDEYEVKVIPGVYRIIVPEFRGHKMANFFITAGDVVRFRIPVSRLAAQMICRENTRILKVYNSETPSSDQDKRYALPPYSKVRSEARKVAPPFDMTIRYCSMERVGEKTVYKGAEVYYKNYYVIAPTIILSRDTLELEGANTEGETVYVEMNGVEVSIPERKISLR